MEWDCAGFGITREDIQRMKTWHPNAIRLAVMDKLWSGASTGNATCSGPAYQREVKRVINWMLQAGIDVIFDLHYVSGGTSFDTSGVPTGCEWKKLRRKWREGGARRGSASAPFCDCAGQSGGIGLAVPVALHRPCTDRTGRPRSPRCPGRHVMSSHGHGVGLYWASLSSSLRI
jgi:hypothetical protein